MSVSRHPPITEVAVFSVEPRTHIGIGVCLSGECHTTWYALSLIHVGKGDAWTEYRIDGWMTQFPSCLSECLCCASMKKITTLNDYPSTTFFSNNDRYGYFREPNSNRIGYSVKEGTDFFVNYLAPPPVWERSNHCSQWPPQFQREVWSILLCCKRLGGPWRNLADLLIQQLAQLWLCF